MRLTRVLGVAVVTVALALLVGCSQGTGGKASRCGACSCGSGGSCGCAQKAAAEKGSAAAIEQKTCPVTGESINPAAFTEYKGKKVYFCCQGCIDKFTQDPGEYLAKLK